MIKRFALLLALAVSLALAGSASAGGVANRRPMWPVVGGGGGGAFTFIASASGAADSSGTTVATSSTLNVASGDLLISLTSYEDDASAGTTVGITDGGSNSFTFDAGEEIRSSGDQVSAHPGYRLSAVANASATFTATLTNARPYKRIIVYQYRPSAGTTSKDISGTREATANSEGITTGSFSTAGSYGVVCAMGAYYTSGTYSGWLIAGAAADQTLQQNSATMWCSLSAAPISTQTAYVYYPAVNYWAATVIAFKSE